MFIAPGYSPTILSGGVDVASSVSSVFSTITSGMVTLSASKTGVFSTLTFNLQMSDGKSWVTFATWDAKTNITQSFYLNSNAIYQLFCTGYAGGTSVDVSATIPTTSTGGATASSNLPLANNIALATAVVDGSGNQITSFGGGTQYADGVTQSTPTGTAALGKNPSNVLHALALDSSGNLNVNVAAGGASGGTSSSFGSAFPGTGTAAGASDGTNMQALQVESASNKNLRVGLYNGANEASVSAGGAVKVDNSAVTQPISGTVTANIGTSGSLALDATLTGGTQKSKLVDTGGTNIASVSAAGALKVDGSAVTQPVSGAFFQATQPVSASSLPLPTGASTAAKQPALGTAGTASADVISVQGVASMTALKVDGSGVTQPVSGTFFQATQPVSAAALPLPSGASTSAKQPALGTAGTPSSDVLTVQGATSMTALKVDGSGVTQPVSGTVTANAGTNLNTSALALDATLTGGTQKSKLVDTGGTNVASVSAAGALKVDGSAVTQPVSGTFFQATQPVSVAAAVSVTQASLTKGTQGANGVSTQDLKDAGRTYVTFTALAAAGVTSEALFSFSQNKQGTVTGAVTSYVVTSGKTLRITAITISVRAGAAAVPFSRCVLRHNTAGATTASSPVAFLCPEVFGISATIGVGGQIAVAIPDGLEFRGDGTQTIGMSHLDQATTNIINVTICGFEY